MDNKPKEKNKIEKIYSRTNIRLPKISSLLLQKKSITPKQKHKYVKIGKIALVVIIALTVVNISLTAVEPIVDQQCIEIAKSIATKVSNEQATRVMADYKYEDLCRVTVDEDYNIKMVNMDMITVNKIISDIPILIQEELEKDDINKFYIKLGSFTGSKLLSGRGPDIEIKIASVGTVETDLKSEFQSAGINQTMHRIYLEVRCNVTILTPFNSIEEEIINQVLLAENLIVGNIPDTYYNLEGLHQDDALEIVN